MQNEVPFLWSHRKMKDFQKTEIMAMEGVGIRKHVIMDVLQCRYGGYGKVGIIRKDAYNFSSRYKRSRIADGDAMAVLGLMQSRQKDDPDFYYDYQMDSDGHLKTMFWCDSQSRMDYQSFGDVVIFDSTYRMNRYKMPFVPFVGMNHHRSTTVFGCGIVSDERIDSYVCMLGAFMKAMCQQKPQSTITDGDCQRNGNGVPITLDSCVIKEDGTRRPRQPATSIKRSSGSPIKNIRLQEVGTRLERAGPDPSREARRTFPSPRRHPPGKKIFTRRLRRLAAGLYAEPEGVCSFPVKTS